MWKSFNVTTLLLSLAGSQVKWASKAHSVSLWNSPSTHRVVCTPSSMVVLYKAASIFTQTLLADLEIENLDQLLHFFPAKIPCEFGLAQCNYCGWGRRISGNICVCPCSFFLYKDKMSSQGLEERIIMECENMKGLKGWSSPFCGLRFGLGG